MKSNLTCDFSSPVFKHLLASYEQMIRAHESVYFDLQQIVTLSTFYYYANQLDEALKVLDYGISIYKNEERLLLIKSKILIKQKNYIEAETLLNNLMGNEAPEVSFEKAMLAAITGKKAVAENHFDNLIKSVRNKRQTYVSVAYFYLSNHFIHEGEKWWELAQKNPSFDYNFFYTRVVYELVNKDYEKAFRHSISLIKKYPNALISWLLLARSQFVMNKYDDAYRSANCALNLHPRCHAALKIKEESKSKLTRHDTQPS